ncbi:MAG: hypothetical protein WDW38_009315 [Sanguina aurantia]
MREASSAPVKQRMTLLQDVLGELQHAKTHQAYASLPGSGSGVWISVSLYRSVLHQLKYQVQEILEWESLLVATRQELEDAQSAAEMEKIPPQLEIARLMEQVAALEGSLAQQQEELQASQADWAQHKAELERQADHCMGLVKVGEGVHEQGAALAETGGRGLTQRDALSLQVHDLAVQLSEARSQGEALRVQLASRQQPAEELVAELRRVRDDNGRLIALLADTPQFRGLSEELSSGSGLTYLPLGDLLLQQGLVGQAYLQLTDRPVSAMSKREAGAAPRTSHAGRHAPLSDPPEDYHWVPKAALEAGQSLLTRIAPGLPRGQVLPLVAELNKVWRRREHQKLAQLHDKHEAAVLEVHALYKQRAPFESAVAGMKVADLRRQLKVQAAAAVQMARHTDGQARAAADDSKVILHLGLSSIETLTKQVRTLTTRSTNLSKKLAAAQVKAETPAPTPPMLCSSLFQLQPEVESAPMGQQQQQHHRQYQPHHQQQALQLQQCQQQLQQCEQDLQQNRDQPGHQQQQERYQQHQQQQQQQQLPYQKGQQLDNQQQQQQQELQQQQWQQKQNQSAPLPAGLPPGLASPPAQATADNHIGSGGCSSSSSRSSGGMGFQHTLSQPSMPQQASSLGIAATDGDFQFPGAMQQQQQQQRFASSVCFTPGTGEAPSASSPPMVPPPRESGAAASDGQSASVAQRAPSAGGVGDVVVRGGPGVVGPGGSSGGFSVALGAPVTISVRFPRFDVAGPIRGSGL